MSEAPPKDIQERFFGDARRDRAELVVYLMNGIKLRGRIKSYDRFTFVLESDGHEQLIFKHAVSTVGAASAREPARRGLESAPFNAPRPARAVAGGAGEAGAAEPDTKG
jgi:host factor-I protein